MSESKPSRYVQVMIGAAPEGMKSPISQAISDLLNSVNENSVLTDELGDRLSRFTFPEIKVDPGPSLGVKEDGVCDFALEIKDIRKKVLNNNTALRSLLDRLQI